MLLNHYCQTRLLAVVTHDNAHDYAHEGEVPIAAAAAHLLKQVAHAAGSHSHEQLHKLGGGAAEEGRARLASNSLGQQRLACRQAGRHKQSEGCAGELYVYELATKAVSC
jgi:hypothetical protein